MTDSGTATGSSSSSEDAAGASSSSGGYESDSDSSYGSDLRLDNINCQLCRQPLSRRPRRGLLGRRRKPHGSSQFLVCDCCQRTYHEDCCRCGAVYGYSMGSLNKGLLCKAGQIFMDVTCLHAALVLRR